MKTLKTSLSALLAAATLFAATPVAAFTLIERNSTVDTQMTLTQIALCDGSVKLMPGTYDVHISSLADGSAHAVFLQGGVRKGEANGRIVVNSRPAGAAQKTQTFSSLGFNASSHREFRQEGQTLTFVYGVPAGNQILIGLLLPAVQKNPVGK